MFSTGCCPDLWNKSSGLDKHCYSLHIYYNKCSVCCAQHIFFPPLQKKPFSILTFQSAYLTAWTNGRKCWMVQVFYHPSGQPIYICLWQLLACGQTSTLPTAYKPRRFAWHSYTPKTESERQFIACGLSCERLLTVSFLSAWVDAVKTYVDSEENRGFNTSLFCAMCQNATGFSSILKTNGHAPKVSERHQQHFPQCFGIMLFGCLQCHIVSYKKCVFST